MLPQSLIETIKEDLIRHEGYMTEVYLDTEGLPTAGIGHLLEGDEILPVGTEVSEEQIQAWFDKDFEEAYSDCCALFLNFDSHPDEAKRVLVNMAFNLGRSRLGKFKNTIRYVNEGNYIMAANEMIDSKWYNQVGHRSAELVNIMKEV